MAHYFIHQERIGPPFQSVREMKTVIPGGVDSRQTSRYPKMVFVLDGDCSVRMMDGFHAHLQRGDVLLVPKPCHHYYASADPGKDAELYAFCVFFKPFPPLRKRPAPFEAEWSRLVADLFSANRHLPGLAGATLQPLINAFREEYDSGKIGSLVKQTAICQEIVIELARLASEAAVPGDDRGEPHSQAFVAGAVKNFLGKTVGRKHSLPEIAWRFRLSEEHLARSFKKETGISVMAYLRKIRVEGARTMLLSTNETVAVLATRLGFSSSNHFCRAFTQLTGQSPMEYRRRHAGVNDPDLPKKAKQPR